MAVCAFGVSAAGAAVPAGADSNVIRAPFPKPNPEVVVADEDEAEAGLTRDRETVTPSYADPERSDVLRSLPTPSVAASALPSPGDLNALAVGFSQETYLSRQAPGDRGEGYRFVSARLRTRARTKNPHFFSYLELGGGFATNVENMSYITVPEAYLRWSSEPTPVDAAVSGFTGRRIAPGLSLLVGRAKEKWSRLDEDWSLGLWQPLFRWDWVRPESQGLTGAFVSMETRSARLVLFGTPIFIPEQGPQFELQDGKFSSTSPWFNGPPDAVVLFSRRDDIRYNLRTPSVGSVISHGAAGAMAQLGDPTADGVWAQASYAYKPRNQLDLPFEAFSGSLGPTAIVYPDVAYHHLVSADVGARVGRISTQLSGLRESPVNQDRPSAITFSRLSQMTALSPSFEWAIPFALGWRPRLKAAYLIREGGDLVDVNALPTQSGSAFGPRFPYRQAFSVAFRATTAIAHGRVLDFGVRAIQEVAEKGTVLMADLRFQPAPAWTVTVGADILGSALPDGNTSTYIARDRGNDRGFVGAAYAF